MLIIEQSEADEEAALEITAKTAAEAEIKEFKKTETKEPKKKLWRPSPMADVKEEMKIIHDPTFGENRKRNRSRMVSLVQELCPVEGRTGGSFVCKYNWNIPQLEYNPLHIKHMILYG